MSETLTAWIITDGRPGHLNQIRGLVARLEAKCDLQTVWLDMSKKPFPPGMPRPVSGLNPHSLGAIMPERTWS